MKGFRIPLDLAAEFEKACTLMGMKEQEAARQALEDWLRKNKDQASLESYLNQGRAKPVIFQRAQELLPGPVVQPGICGEFW